MSDKYKFYERQIRYAMVISYLEKAWTGFYLTMTI